MARGRQAGGLRAHSFISFSSHSSLLSVCNGPYLIMGNKMLLIGLIVLATLSCLAQQSSSNNAATNQTATTQTTNSGIRGVMVRWPITPSSRLGQPNSAPMPDIEVSLRPEHGDTEISSQRTDTNGHFAFSVPSGKYTIVPLLPPGRRSRVRKVTAEVKPNQFTNIVIMFDTGIR